MPTTGGKDWFRIALRARYGRTRRTRQCGYLTPHCDQNHHLIVQPHYDAERPPAPELTRGMLRKWYLPTRTLRGIDRVLAATVTRRPRGAAPSRILLVNLAHLGDVLLTAGVADLLKAAIPGAHIGFLGGSWSESLVSPNPAIDERFVWDHALLARGAPVARRTLRHVRSASQVREAIRAGRFDAAIDLSPFFPPAAHLLRRSGIPFVAGHSTTGLSSLYDYCLPWDATDRSLADRSAALVCSALGLRGSESAGYPRFLGPGAAPRSDDGTVCVLPGRRHPKSSWPDAHWVEVLRSLTERGRAVTLIGAGDDERRRCDALAAAAPGVTNLCGAVPIPGLIDVLRRSVAYVGADSGVAHLAAAIGTQVVVLRSGMTPNGLWRPLGDRVTVLQQPVLCAPCFISRGCVEMPCLRQVSPGMVVEAVP